MSGSTQCPHPEVRWTLNEQRFGDTNLRYIEIKGYCTTCNGVVEFRGAPIGHSPHHPAMEVGGAEMRLPFLFAGEPLVGRPIGYTITKEEMA